MTIALAVLVGALTGVLSGFGIGGGSLLLLYLTLCAGMEQFAAGGVNLSNAEEYAATGVDGLATTCLHFAKPLDMSVRMAAL